MGGFNFGMPRSKAGALRYQEELKNELAGLVMKDKPSEKDVARIKRIRQYFSVIGKPLPSIYSSITDLEPIPVEDSAPHKFAPMPGNRRGMPCNKCLERRSHANHSPDAIKDYEASKRIEARNLTPAKATDKRARMHRALDAVIDSARK